MWGKMAGSWREEAGSNTREKGEGKEGKAGGKKCTRRVERKRKKVKIVRGIDWLERDLWGNGRESRGMGNEGLSRAEAKPIEKLLSQSEGCHSHSRRHSTRAPLVLLVRLESFYLAGLLERVLLLIDSALASRHTGSFPLSVAASARLAPTLLPSFPDLLPLFCTSSMRISLFC